VLAACLAATACGGGGDDDEPLRDARAKLAAAPYLQVGDVLLSPRLTVIRRGRRVLAWTGVRAELIWSAAHRCYNRRTQFNRDDARQLRAAAAVPGLTEADEHTRDGTRILTGREAHSDFADTEFEVSLDTTGRIALVRQRSARFGVIPPGRWSATRYRYPTAEQFARLAGPAPTPRCR
jgi:hypothetical protein